MSPRRHQVKLLQYKDLDSFGDAGDGVDGHFRHWSITRFGPVRFLEYAVNAVTNLI